MGERDLASFVPDEEAYGNGLEESGRRDSPQWVQKFFPTGIERSQEGQKARLQTLHWPSRISAVQWGQYFTNRVGNLRVGDLILQNDKYPLSHHS